jgi:hypothetical protein
MLNVAGPAIVVRCTHKPRRSPGTFHAAFTAAQTCRPATGPGEARTSASQKGAEVAGRSSNSA